MWNYGIHIYHKALMFKISESLCIITQQVYKLHAPWMFKKEGSTACKEVTSQSLV